MCTGERWRGEHCLEVGYRWKLDGGGWASPPSTAKRSGLQYVGLIVGAQQRHHEQTVTGVKLPADFRKQVGRISQKELLEKHSCKGRT